MHWGVKRKKVFKIVRHVSVDYQTIEKSYKTEEIVGEECLRYLL